MTPKEDDGQLSNRKAHQKQRLTSPDVQWNMLYREFTRSDGHSQNLQMIS